MSIYIKNKVRRTGEFQFFMHQFVESAIKKGIIPLPEFANRNFCMRLIRKLSSILIFLPHKDKNIIIPSSGGSLRYDCIPYYRYNIIPFLWDVWPDNLELLFNDIKRLKIKMAFVTSKQNRELIEKTTGIRCYYIPEGIDVTDYNRGEDLINRNIDLYELGRQHPEYHNVILSLKDKHFFKGYYANEYDKYGNLQGLAFATAGQLLQNINKIKIVVCFPQCDTHPQRAGNIETLTQRYWECMLSGNLIIGRAPKELIELVGYNPVVDIDWNAPEEQLKDVLRNISDYQDLVDENYKVALKFASWDDRIDHIINILVLHNILI